MSPTFRPGIAILGAIAVFVAGGIGGSVTPSAIQDGWYGALTKPPLQPPSFLFGIVWPILYVLIAASWVIAYRRQPENLRALALPFGIQLALNALWSVVFFGLKAPVGALAIILLLLATITWMMQRFGSPARWLLVPYILWVSFATYLNAGIVVLNR
jgi:tryptophan-rich sensory protein